MLSKLLVENVAVIEKTEVDFCSGLNVFTGETGAGKSILIDAINAVLGERTSKDVVRNGAKKAVVTAVFTNISNETKEKLDELGLLDEDNPDDVILQREITAEGKSVCRVNFNIGNTAIMRELAFGLINIHGQHDSQVLLNSDKHIGIIDKYADLSCAIKEYQDVYFKLRDTEKRIKETNTDEAEKQRRLDILSYQINEIESAEILENEDEELEARRNLLKNSESVIKLLKQSLSMSDENENGVSAIDLIKVSSDSLESAADIAADLKDDSQRLTEIYYDLCDIVSNVSRYYDNFGYDGEELQDIEDRLDLINTLKRKYASTIPEIHEYLSKIKREISEINRSDEVFKELQTQKKMLENDALRLAEGISKMRVNKANEFAELVCGELKFLDMPNIRLLANRKEKDLSSDGIDSIEFLISVNPGEPPKSMAKIASGGELSRIMLAIKSVLADKDDIDSLIFDEIDTGVSGSGAGKIGQKLKALSSCRQVICITHQAQIAAKASEHLLIKKDIVDDRAYTTVRSLSIDERANELARIMGGNNISSALLESAKEMLNNN